MNDRKSNGTHFIRVASTILKTLVILWNTLEDDGEADEIQEKMQVEMNNLARRLSTVLWGFLLTEPHKYEIWGTIEEYRLAELSPPMDGKWVFNEELNRLILPKAPSEHQSEDEGAGIL